MKRPSAGGGWPALLYSWHTARRAGGLWKMWSALRSKNACKTCALGMGGQEGGMVNERGSFPEVCKKSFQAMAADMQGAIPADFWPTYSLAQLQCFSPRQLEHAGRLVSPVRFIQGESHYQPAGLEDGLDRIADVLSRTDPQQTFWYFSGRSSNEAGFLLQLFARLYGTNNVNNCSFYCHQASGVGLTSSVGNGTSTVNLEDLEQTELVFVIGGNPASNHPRLMTTLKNIRRRGGDVIVINPVKEVGLVRFRVPSDPVSLLWGSEIASQYIQPHAGGDLALLSAIAKRVDELKGQDDTYLQGYCHGYEPWLRHIRSLDWDLLQSISGVARQEIDQAARRYARARSTVFTWTMGITHHTHGVDNVQAIANLALQRGMVGRPHCGLLPIRGHSNVQGIGSVGVTPKLKEAIFSRLQSDYGVTLPTSTGLDTLACMEAAHAGQLRVGVCLGGNLFGSNPDSQFAAAALNKLDLLVYISTSLNTGHAHGLARETWILPVAARDEEPEPTTQESMFNYVRMSDGGPARHVGLRSEVQTIADLAGKVLDTASPIDWNQLRDTGNIRQMIARVVPGFGEIADIERTKKEFTIEGRVLHHPHFPTDDGKARLHVHEIRPVPLAARQLRLMTVRSEGQFNTVVYEDYDLYRGQERRDVILVHPHDVERFGLRADQLVSVRSATGRMDRILVRPYPDIRAGNALMYYPEANQLVPRLADGQSKTPSFKHVLVELEPI